MSSKFTLKQLVVYAKENNIPTTKIVKKRKDELYKELRKEGIELSSSKKVPTKKKERILKKVPTKKKERILKKVPTKKMEHTKKKKVTSKKKEPISKEKVASKKKRHAKNKKSFSKIIKFKPFLIRDGNDFIYDLDTGSKKVNKLLKERIKNDYTNVDGILSYLKKSPSKDYEFDGEFIYITLEKEDGSAFTEEDIQTLKNRVDPDGLGTDTWMEGDIDILHKDELKGSKYEGEDGIELGVKVEDVLDS